jgi:hypothetical protein
LAVQRRNEGGLIWWPARAMLADGAIGEIWGVQVEYRRKWLIGAAEQTGKKQAE